jgi:hypothetical protein
MAASWSKELGVLVERGVALQVELDYLAQPRKDTPPDMAGRMRTWADDADAFVARHLSDQLPLYRSGLMPLEEPLIHGTARDFVDPRLQHLRGYLEGDRVALREILTSARSTDSKTTALVILTVVLLARDLHWI